MFPAACIGDPVSHDTTTPAGVVSFPISGPCPMGPVIIQGLPAAHVMCQAICSGITAAGPIHPPPVPPAPPGFPIIKGSTTVRIHGFPAVRLFPSADVAACTTMIGIAPLLAARKVFIGG